MVLFACKPSGTASSQPSILSFFRRCRRSIGLIQTIVSHTVITYPDPEVSLHLMEAAALERRAQALIESISNSCENGNLGSATVAVYDTAWVSMIEKKVNGQAHWLFPESFEYLLDSQLPDGSWESYASPEDGILNTLAALLAMKKHSNVESIKEDASPSDLEGKISKAKETLESKLQAWDVECAVHVDFEILVPSLLTLLESEGLNLILPNQGILHDLKSRKIAKLDPKALYREPTTFVHSLEAMVGVLDFDKLGHLETSGSMMGSPASTSAFLIYSSKWDLEAEGYLCRVIAEGQSNWNGGVPSVFPMGIFETSWAGEESQCILFYEADQLQRYSLRFFRPTTPSMILAKRM